MNICLFAECAATSIAMSDFATEVVRCGARLTVPPPPQRDASTTSPRPPNPFPDDHSTCDDCAKQDDTKVPAGDGGSDEAKDVEEDVEMSTYRVRGGEMVRWTVYTCLRGKNVECDRCADSDA